MNHFAKKCLSKMQANAIATDNESDDEEYCLTINSNVEHKTINNHSVNEHKSQNKLFATFYVEGKPVKLQLDSGATCNVIPGSFLEKQEKIKHDKKNPDDV